MWTKDTRPNKDKARHMAMSWITQGKPQKAHIGLIPSYSCEDVNLAQKDNLFTGDELLHCIEKRTDYIETMRANLICLGYFRSIFSPENRQQFIYKTEFDNLDINSLKDNLKGQKLFSAFWDFCGLSLKTIAKKQKELVPLYYPKAHIALTFNLPVRNGDSDIVKPNVSLKTAMSRETGHRCWLEAAANIEGYRSSISLAKQTLDIKQTFTYNDTSPMVLILGVVK